MNAGGGARSWEVALVYVLLLAVVSTYACVGFLAIRANADRVIEVVQERCEVAR